MSVQVLDAIVRARDVLGVHGRGPVEKTMWSSPAGKTKIAERLAALLPSHKTYVEPFCGSAAVLFAKELSEVEAINDADQEIVQAYRRAKRLSGQQIERLSRMNWVGNEATYKRLLDSKPTGDLAKLYRFLYVTHFSYGRMRGRSFSPSASGVKSNTVARVKRCVPRLKTVDIHGGDYERVIKQYDSADTVFFLDPPYSGYDTHVGESKFDEERFFEVLKSIKGKWLMTYGIRGKLPELLKGSRFHVKRFRTPRHIRQMRGVEGPTVLTQLLVSNYTLVDKHLKDFSDLEPHNPDPNPETEPFIKSMPIIKGADPNDERYVLGVVLEPEVVDAQGDIYSGEEIRQAAHRFMEEFQGLGLMHRLRVNDDVKILESYLAPVDFEIGDTKVRRGTWLLAVRILSDDLWQRVKDGELTGFSIGGSARKVPEKRAAA